MKFPYPWKTTRFIEGNCYDCVFDNGKYGKRRWFLESELTPVKIIKRTSQTVLVTDGKTQWRMKIRLLWGDEIAYRHDAPFVVWSSANKVKAI